MQRRTAGRARARAFRATRWAALACILSLATAATVVALIGSQRASAATTCAVGTPYSNVVSETTGLVGYWRLGDSIGTQACDQLGLNPGTYSSGVTLGRPGALAGDADTAVAFNGTTGNASIPSTTALNTADVFSIEAWVKRGTTGGSANQVIASKGTTAWTLAFNTANKLILQVNGKTTSTSSTAVADTTAWHHVVATKSGTTTKLYIDGVDVTGTGTNGTGANNTTAITIGSAASATWLNGTLDDVAVYKVALTKDQVTNHFLLGAAACAPNSSYSRGVSGTTGLVGYWRLGAASGTTACDSAGLNPGTYTGGVTLGQAGGLSGDSDSAALFNGTTGWVSIAPLSTLNTGDTFTVEGWLKRGTTGGTANQVIASKQGSAWTLAFNSANKLVLQSGTTVISTSTATVTDTSAWHYVAATKAGAAVHLFLDGADVTGAVTNMTLANSTSPLAIGQSGNAGWFNGRLDEVALYNVALSSAQMSGHYSLGIVPANSAVPTISGTPVDGATLTASPGTWSGAAPTYTYQWRSCDSSGSSCQDIASASAQAYTLGHGDVGNAIRVVVTATNAGGSATATSQPSATVAAAVPSNTAAPTISGSAVSGQALTASPGTWAGTPGSYAYQWQRCDAAGANCTAIGGAGAQSYTLTGSEVGNRVRVLVTSTNSAGSASAASQPSAAVADVAPTNTASPTISGAATEGTRLTSTDGTWQGTATSVSYQWQSCDASGASCAAITGATSSTYVVQNADHGHALRLVVTKSNQSGSGIGTSDPTQPAVGNLPAIVYGPAINGGSQPPVRDEQLFAGSSAFSGVVTSQTVQWQHCDAQGGNCEDIPGAIASSYTLGVGDIGMTIRVAAIATNAAGSTRAYSPTRGPIASGAPTNTLLPSVSGTPVEDSLVEAVDGGWTGSVSSTSYLWRRCDSAGADCVDVTSARSYSTYLVTNADHGHTLRVLVTKTGTYGSGAAVSTPSTVATGKVPQVLSNPSVDSDTDPPVQAHTMNAWSGTYRGVVNSRSFQWQRCDSQGQSCSDLAGEVSASHLLGAADVGARLRVIETTTNAAGSTTATSAASNAVLTAAPRNTVLPRVFGSAAEGTPITSNDGTWAGAVSSTAYQWQRCDASGAACVDIETGGTGSSYEVVNADHGHTFRLTVTKTGTYGSGQATSAVSAVAVGNPPTAFSGPVLSGAAGDPPMQGETLTASPASFGGTVTSRSFQWQRCDAQGTNCADIAGATDASYALGLADVGARVRAGETASNAAGSAPAYSTATTAVITGVPLNTSLPTISGTPAEGHSLFATPGAWSGLSPDYDYQWQRCDAQGGSCVDIEHGRQVAYDMTPADAGASLRVRVTASNVNGSASATSAASGAVAPAQPVSAGLPEISGSARQGDTLSASTGSWTGAQLDFSYQWRRCDADGLNCADLGGATDPTYQVGTLDSGNTMRVVVVASNSAGTASATSAPSELVDPPPPTNVSAPTVTGFHMEGQTLEASPGTWAGGSPRYSYQWQQCDADGSDCADLQGATEHSYELGSGDVGHALRVRVTATNGADSADALSDATAATDELPMPEDPILIGTPDYDQPLTVGATAPPSIPDPQFSYQWERCDEETADCEPIEGATQVVYRPQAQDLGSRVRARVKVHMVAAGSLVNLYDLFTPLTPALRGSTAVTGTHSADAPLVIDPSSDPKGRGTDVTTALSRPLEFIQRMPSTKRVNSVTLGDLAAGPGCASPPWSGAAPQVRLVVHEHPTGDLVPGGSNPTTIYPGKSTMIAMSTDTATLSTAPGQVTWKIPATTFKYGYGYSFSLELNGGCNQVSVTSWVHNRAKVNSGPRRCTIMPPGLEVWDGQPPIVNAPGAGRVWHQAGMEDLPSGCLVVQNGEGFKASMPTGWLAVKAVDGFDRELAVGNAPASGQCEPSLAGRGAKTLPWSGSLLGGPRAEVCAWRQFAPPGTQLRDGWYYGSPWSARYNGAPRDLYLKLGTESVVDPLAAKFEPVLKFDKDEQWRPLDIDSFIDEGDHRICPDDDGDTCDGGSPLADDIDFPIHPHGHIDIKGAFDNAPQSGNNDEGVFKSPFAHCKVGPENKPVRDCDSGPRSSIYYRAVPNAFGYMFYDYWFFYRANFFGLQSADFHEGDWEAVSVGVEAQHPGTFSFVSFSEHGGFYSYLRRNLACEDAPSGQVPSPGSCGTTGKRVNVMVANGSHANYAHPCTEDVTGLTCSSNKALEHRERGYSGTYRWGNAYTPDALRVMPTTWENWAGKWGSTPPGTLSPGSPESPGRQGIDIDCSEYNNDVSQDDHTPGGCVFSPHARARADRFRHSSKRRRGRTRLTKAKPRQGGSYRSPGEVASSCGSWLGEGVAAAVCDQAQLSRAVDQTRLDEPGQIDLRVAGRSEGAASAPGITQLTGSFLRDGDRLVLSGRTTAGAELSVRVADPAHHQTAIAKFGAGDLLPQRSIRGTGRRLRIGLRHGRAGRLSVRINGHAAKSVRMESRPGKRKHKRRRHGRRKHP